MTSTDIIRTERPAEAVSALCQSVAATPETVNHVDVMLYRHCREGRGSTTALCFDGETYSYQYVADASVRCATWLRSSGVEAGDRVILILPDCPALVAAYFGVVAAGAVAIILDPALPAEDAYYITQLCQARLAIVHDSLRGKLVGLDALSGMLGVVGTDVTWTRPSELAAAMSRQPSVEWVVRTAPGSYAYGLLTSGSTGRPKLIVHRHQDILHGYFAFAKPVLRLASTDRVMSFAKMSTGYGLGCSVLMPFLAGASAALVSESPTVEAMNGAIESHRCTLLFAQPRLLAIMRSASDLAGRLRSLRLVVTGGEPLSTTLAESWALLSHAELLDSYGSTEVGFLYISNRPGDARRGSVGKPVEGLQLEVIEDGGKVVPPGQIGKLRVRGPMIINGYWNDSLRSSQSFQDGWFTTSDMFSIDGDGWYYIHGRSDHLIKLGCGDWVNPHDIEMVLHEHRHVRECAVVGAPDHGGLTVLRALVVVEGCAPGHALAVELSDLVRERWPLQEYKHVGIVEFTKGLPKTTAGKLDRAKLHPQSMTEFSYRC